MVCAFPLLIQPIIENAFKHGLFHKKGEKNLIIEFNVVDEMLQCVVIDNGIGISEARKINQWKKQDHKSAGISTTRERLSMLHSENPKFNTEHPFLKIIDLTENGKLPAPGLKCICNSEFSKNECIKFNYCRRRD